MYTRSLILTVMLVAAPGLIWAAGAPLATLPATVGTPDSAKDTGKEATKAATDAAKQAKTKAPCPTTGTHIKQKPGAPCPAVDPTHSYSQQDLESTGEVDVGAALKKLDPSIH